MNIAIILFSFPDYVDKMIGQCSPADPYQYNKAGIPVLVRIYINGREPQRTGRAGV